MPWTGITNKQCVSFNNLKNAVNNGVFTQKQTIPDSNQLITKSAANVYVNINVNKTSYTNKGSNQLVVKEDLEAISVFNYCVGYSNVNCSTACTNYNNNAAL